MLPCYYSLNEYLNKTYGHKLYKLALSGYMTCPNRDGKIDTRGCIFCSRGGSGDFAGNALIGDLSYNVLNTLNSTKDYKQLHALIDMQICAAKKNIASKYSGNKYIAYFQSYTNTYADITYLKELYTYVISRPDIEILSIATRPDCLNNDVLSLLMQLNRIKPVWIELGLQTIHETTANYIRRGYKLDVFDKAINDLHSLGINVIVHMIVGLPGETKDMMLDTAKYIAKYNVFGIKLQLLHILSDTDLYKDYLSGAVMSMELDEYVRTISSILEILPPNMVIHRLTGDGPKKLLIAPKWSSNKKLVLNTLNNYLKNNNIYQGRFYHEY